MLNKIVKAAAVVLYLTSAVFSVKAVVDLVRGEKLF